MQIGVLGRLRAVREGHELDLGPRKQRAVLAALALRLGQPVPADAVVDLVWGEQPPAAVTASLHGYIAALRRVLEPDRAVRARASVITTDEHGYALRISPESVDAYALELAASSARDALGADDPLAVPDHVSEFELTAQAAALAAVLESWRGEPYVELDLAAPAAAERNRLLDLRLQAARDLTRIQLGLRQPAAAATTVAGLCAEHPLREDLTALLALALARSGRQADALAALQTARQVLDLELGVDPGPRLRDLEVAILRQDPAVMSISTRRAPAAHSVRPGRAVGGATRAPLASLVGRQEELRRLTEVLDDESIDLRTGARRVRVAQLVGEAGIGKSRLTRELADLARGRGFLVASSRCSSDEGAPPLWPWLAVLRALSAGAPDSAVTGLEAGLSTTRGHAADLFWWFEDVADGLRSLALTQPVLLVFEDVHWADPSTVRLLRHLVDGDLAEGVAVVLTRRSHPAPVGVQAELAVSLARSTAVRLDLTGLDESAVQALADEQGAALGSAVVRTIHDRSGGNPFFVLELLELFADRGSEEGLVPRGVAEVVNARLDRLPATTRRLVQLATTVGRRFELDVLAGLAERDDELVFDELGPALAAGLMLADGRGGFAFDHALVRDAVEATVPTWQRHRWHADAARLLEGAHPDQQVPDHRLAEVARHWQAAGSAHVARAWPAAERAGHYAAGLGAHDEAATLLAAAAAAQAADPAATIEQRYTVQMALGAACRANADSHGQQAATEAAIGLAATLADPERLASAAIAGSEGALWSNRPEGEVDRVTVAALHQALDQLPDGDTELRCRVLLALSRELYWAPGGAESAAWAERGLAMARRLADPRLQAWACHTSWAATIAPQTLAARITVTAEAISCSRAAGDVEGEAIGLFLHAVDLAEAGRVDERAETTRQAMVAADRSRLRYLQVMLGAFEVPWLALHGRFAAADELLTSTLRRAEQANFPFRDEAVVTAQGWLAMWRASASGELDAGGGLGALVDLAVSVDADSPTDMSSALALLMLRADRVDQAAELLRRHPIPLVDDHFAAPLDLAIGAEASLLLGDPELAAGVYPLLTPWAGRTAMAGTGAPLGPVDAFLALAAAAVGESGLAGRHADDADRLIRSWGMPPVGAWFSARRRSYGF